MADDDTRDERIGAWLEVEPLDEVTRRRLVSTALAATDETAAPTDAPVRRSYAARWIAAAASIVILLVTAIVLLTAPGGHDEQEASTPVRSPEVEQKSAGATGSAADSATPEAASGATDSAAPSDAGDFGNLDVPANLDRLRAALEAGFTAAGTTGAPANATRSLAALPCSGDLPAGTITAVGSGTLDGRRAVVVLITLPDGTRSIDAVLASPCEVHPLS